MNNNIAIHCRIRKSVPKNFLKLVSYMMTRLKLNTKDGVRYVNIRKVKDYLDSAPLAFSFRLPKCFLMKKCF